MNNSKKTIEGIFKSLTLPEIIHLSMRNDFDYTEMCISVSRLKIWNLMTYEIMNMYFKSYKNKQNHLSFALGQTERTESTHFIDVKLG